MEKRLEEDSSFKESYEQMVSTLDIPVERTTPHRTAARNTKLNVGYTQSRYPTLTVIKNKKRSLRVSLCLLYELIVGLFSALCHRKVKCFGE